VYGHVDEGLKHEAVLCDPSEMQPQFSTVSVTTSSSLFQNLTDAIRYLMEYPHGCTEQVSSQLIVLASTYDLLDQVKSKAIPNKDAAQQKVAAAVALLKSRQQSSGAFGYWGYQTYVTPFASVHATNALLAAKQAGFDVPEDLLQKALTSLSTLNTWSTDKKEDLAGLTTEAYALAVRHKAGHKGLVSRAIAISRKPSNKVSAEMLAWLLPIVKDAGDKTATRSISDRINKKIQVDAGTARILDRQTDTNSYATYYSESREDAVVLAALVEADLNREASVKFARHLLSKRRNGAWANTQENAFSALALNKYFRAYEAVDPDFVASIFVDGKQAGSTEMKSIKAVPTTFEVSAIDLLNAGGAQHDVAISKEGRGRLYYRLGLKYAPKQVIVDKMNRGFSVLRSYEAIDDAKDVLLDANGVWHIKAGATVKVKVTMQNGETRHNVALIDPLPAGLEALNPAFLTSRKIADRSSQYWINHQNLRDDKAEAFADTLWQGEHDFAYYATATTPGTYVVPPSSAEEMYTPEVYGHGKTDRLIVE
jgi:alpha-2-macroglobulin